MRPLQGHSTDPAVWLYRYLGCLAQNDKLNFPDMVALARFQCKMPGTRKRYLDMSYLTVPSLQVVPDLADRCPRELRLPRPIHACEHTHASASGSLFWFG
jgi:hypothetical protein